MSRADRQLTVISADFEPEAVRRLLDLALSHCEGELSAADVLDLVGQQRAFLLGVIEHGALKAAGAVEIIEYPRYRVANIIAVGGSGVFLRRDELQWLKTLVKDMGCAKLQTYCRGSVARWLARLGMHESYRVMRLDA